VYQIFLHELWYQLSNLMILIDENFEMHGDNMNVILYNQYLINVFESLDKDKDVNLFGNDNKRYNHHKELNIDCDFRLNKVFQE